MSFSRINGQSLIGWLDGSADLTHEEVFECLTLARFNNPKGFKVLAKCAVKLLDSLESPRKMAFLGYLAYLRSDYKRSEEYFFNVAVAEPSEVYHLICLGFALRHQGQYKISDKILWDLDGLKRRLCSWDARLRLGKFRKWLLG